MEEKKVKCPSCGALLVVRSAQNELRKSIKCPNCAHSITVVFEQKTVYNKVNNQVSGTSTPLVARLYYKGTPYVLQTGSNIVGRRAASSTANIQIATNDRYISRSHLLLRVIPLGNDLKTVLSNFHNKNATYINGQQLQSGDEIILPNGAEIRIGETTLIYKQEPK